MKSILHLKDDTEYQIPLREAEKDDKGTDRAEVGVVGAKDQQNLEASKEEAKQEEAAATQSQDNPTTNKKTDEISQEEVDDADRPATEGLEKDSDETQQPTEGTTPETSNEAPASETPETLDDTLKKLRELSTVEGEITPQVFIDHYKSILNLIEHAMQLRIREGSSATEQKPEPGKEVEKETQENNEEVEKEAQENKTRENTSVSKEN